MKKLLWLAAYSCFAMGAQGTLTVTTNGTELGFDVPQGEEETYTSLIGADVTVVRKTGGGKLLLTGANNAAFVGKIYIDAGTLEGDHGHNGTHCEFGSPSEVHVADGATWRINTQYVPSGLAAWNGQNNVSGAQPCTPLNKTAVFVSGAGVDGKGAICCYSQQSNHNLFGPVTLEGPTTLYTEQRWGFGGKWSSIDANGYDLTLNGKSVGAIFEVARPSLKWTNPGNIYVTNCIALFESGKCTMADNSDALTTKTVFVHPNAELRVLNGTVTHKVHYLGASTSRLKIGNNDNSYVNGPVTGEGGTIVLSQYSTAKKAIDLKLGGGVNGLSVHALANSASHAEFAPYVIEGSATNTINDLLVTDGRVVLCNGSTNVVKHISASNKGIVRITNCVENVVGSMTLDGSGETLRFENAGAVIVTNKVAGEGFNAAVPRMSTSPFKIAWSSEQEAANVTRVTVCGNTVIAPAAAIVPATLTPLYVGIANSGQFARGILDVRDGAVMTNDFFTGGTYSTQLAAIYLSGSDSKIVMPGTNKSMSWFGRGTSYTAFEMTDGTLESGGYVTLGQMGRGFFVQRGGSVKFDPQQLKVGRQGQCYAHYCALGGTYESPSFIQLGFCDDLREGTGHTAVFTVGGLEGSAATATTAYVAGYVASNATASARGNTMVNVNKGGTLRCSRIYRTSVGGWDWAYGVGGAISPMYVNFNGGVLVPAANNCFFSVDGTDADHERRQPTRVTVYGGGAIVDTEGRNVRFTAALQKPYGKGIDEVELTDVESLTANRSIGTRRIRIEGVGAAADVITDFNPEWRVNAVKAVVTNPGFGYDETTTAKVESYKNYGALSNATVRLVDFDAPDYAHGGLTKRGAGTLTLEGANTYGGATRVEGGTLAFTNADGYPGGDIEFPVGAVTNAAAPLVTAQSLVFRSGAKIRVTGADLLDDRQCPRFAAIATSATPIAALPAVEWVDDAGEPVAVNGAWQLRLAGGGTRVEFGYQRGTIVIIR